MSFSLRSSKLIVEHIALSSQDRFTLSLVVCCYTRVFVVDIFHFIFWRNLQLTNFLFVCRFSLTTRRLFLGEFFSVSARWKHVMNVTFHLRNTHTLFDSMMREKSFECHKAIRRWQIVWVTENSQCNVIDKWQTERNVRHSKIVSNTSGDINF